MEPIFSMRGAVVIGDNLLMAKRATWPFGKLTVYPDSVVVEIDLLDGSGFATARRRTFPRRVQLRYEEIVSIEIQSFISYVISFRHTNPAYPPFVEFQVLERKIYHELVRLHHEYLAQHPRTEIHVVAALNSTQHPQNQGLTPLLRQRTFVLLLGVSFLWFFSLCILTLYFLLG